MMTAIARTVARPFLNVEGMEQSRHVCQLYESEEERRAALTCFLRDGIEHNEKIVRVVDDDHTARTVLGDLRDRELDLQLRGVHRQQLKILTAGEAYVQGSVFDVQATIGWLRAETEQALAEGWSGLRVGGDMTWALRGLSGSERLAEFESALDEFLSGSNSLVLCLYDARAFPPDLLVEVLAAHPLVAVGTVTYDNHCYISPAEIASVGRPEARLRRSLQQLADRGQGQDALRTLWALLRAVLAAGPASVLRVDKNGSSVGFIPGDGATPYVPSEEFPGKTMAEVLPAEVAQNAKRYIQLALESGEPQLFGYELLEGEEVRHYETVFVGNGADEVLAIVRDLTEQKRHGKEIERRRIKEELEGRVERQMLGRNRYGLTFREFTVLNLVAAGAADKEIADLLSVSIFTVNKHVSNILAKMNAGSRTEASVRGIREGLLA